MIENTIKFDDINVELDKSYVYKLFDDYGDNSSFIIYMSVGGHDPEYHLLSVHKTYDGVMGLIDNHEYYYNFRFGTKIMPMIKKICKINYEYAN